MSKTFSKDELVILHTEDRGRHTIEIAKIANQAVSYGDQEAQIYMGSFAAKVSVDNLYKLPGAIKRAIKEATK